MSRFPRYAPAGLGLAAALGAALGAALVAALWLSARPLALELSAMRASHRLVLAADGMPLGELGGPDRISGPLLAPGRIPPLLKEAALAAEDRRFYRHPGVDPLAVARALWQNLRAGRVVSGGSTITMQLVRLSRPARRNLVSKLREAWLALGLELHLSKDEILTHYLNRAPFGGPLQGVGAASRWLLHTRADRLGPRQAALLMALPQNPAKLLRPERAAALRARQARILSAMASAPVCGPSDCQPSPPIGLSPPPPLAPAPHFVRALSRRPLPLGNAPLQTYLDPGLQRMAADLVAKACRAQTGRGLRQAAVVVIRNQDRAVICWVGSRDFNAPACGQVDGVLALRQPGSALKPFIYALSLQNGFSPDHLLKDSPLGILTGGGVFRPLNYDHRFQGLVPLRVALASSLNLPSLRLTRQLGPRRVLALLRALGLELELSASHYGLGMALGNGEVSLLSLTNAYATLAREGVHAPPRIHRSSENPLSMRVLDKAACRVVGRILTDDRARERGFGRHGILQTPFGAAVKTGTSQRHRDNWCLGYTPQYTVGVWVGNFEGRPMAGISGVTGAGPLWRRVMGLLHPEPGGRPPEPPPARAAASNLTLPAPRAPRPSAIILSPHQDGVYALDPDTPPQLQTIACRAELGGPSATAGKLTWRLNGRMLPASGDGAHRAPLVPGRHSLELVLNAPSPAVLARVRYTVLP